MVFNTVYAWNMEKNQIFFLSFFCLLLGTLVTDFVQFQFSTLIFHCENINALCIYVYLNREPADG